ncbi:MAG: hypothetical protein Q9169_004943, partial [Polycauliona sp. 2 TL-2023]
MYFLALLGLGSSLSWVAATPGRTFTATFDDRPSSGLVPQLFPIKAPCNGLAFPGFNNFNTAQTITAVPAQSPPNFAA